MAEMIPMKRIPMEHAQNIRDLGGFEAADGRVVRWQRLFRGDCLSCLEEQEWKKLTDRGVRTVLDLRSLSESEAMPDRAPEGVKLAHCPLQKEKIDFQRFSDTAVAAFTRSMEQGYCRMLEEGAELLTAALKEVAEGLKEGAVLFHCTAGKDRTGVLAAVILELLGVAREDIAADYQVSYTYNRKGVNEAARQLPDYEKILPMLRSDAEDMLGFLEFWDAKGGEEFLKSRGLPEETLKTLRAELLGPLVVE